MGFHLHAWSSAIMVILLDKTNMPINYRILRCTNILFHHVSRLHLQYPFVFNFEDEDCMHVAVYT